MAADLTERRNYLRFLLNSYSEILLFFPKIAIYLWGYLNRKIWSIIKINIRIVRQVIKPKTASILAGEISTGRLRLDIKNIPEIKFLSLADKELSEIRLAGATIPVAANLDWQQPFPDKEDSFALHRFGWLLSALVQSPSVKLANKALNWLSSWLQESGQPGPGPAWESYSVAERLSNWPFILALLHSLVGFPPHFLENLEKSMVTQIDYLLNNLELRGKFTNNHLLNDARGLYLAGTFLDSQVATRKAREIFLAWTKEIFSADGMLQENSSHYQYLLHQRYEQVYFLSRQAQDWQFHEFIKRWLVLLAESCNFFSVSSPDGSWDMPLIGDISPDFTPGWLAPNSPSPWLQLKLLLGWRDTPQTPPPPPKAVEIKGSGFIRYSQGKVVLFWHIHAWDPALLKHGHYDLGSFVLFYEGKQVIVDPGRYSYLRSGSFGLGARAHSSLLIDSLGAQCEDHRLNSFRAYGRQKVKHYLAESPQEFNLEIATAGFQRLRTPVAWKRRFTVRKDRLIIMDFLESAGVNQVEARFQVNSGFEVQESGGGFKLSSGSVPPLELKAGDSPPYRCEVSAARARGDSAWVSREYGRRSPGTTILFRRELSRRQVHTYEIIWP